MPTLQSWTGRGRCSPWAPQSNQFTTAKDMSSVRRIGLAIDAVASYGRGIIRGVMAFSRENPRWMISVEPLWSFGTLPAIQEWDVDGLIVQTFSKAFEERVISCGHPATNVSNFNFDCNRLPTIIPDDRAVGKMAADYLISLGDARAGILLASRYAIW